MLDVLQRSRFALINKDALGILAALDSDSVDLIFTDPPYGIGKTGIPNDGDLGVFMDALPELYRVLKPGHYFLTFFSTKRVPDLFRDNPFQYVWQVVLGVPLGHARSPVGFCKFMSVWVFSKGDPRPLNQRNKDYFVDSPGHMISPEEGWIDHPTAKPVGFVRSLIRMFSAPNDVVFDPFMGSGSTGVACMEEGRRFLGVEINNDYFITACDRVRRAAGRAKQQSLFESESVQCEQMDLFPRPDDTEVTRESRVRQAA